MCRDTDNDPQMIGSIHVFGHVSHKNKCTKQTFPCSPTGYITHMNVISSIAAAIKRGLQFLVSFPATKNETLTSMITTNWQVTWKPDWGHLNCHNRCHAPTIVTVYETVLVITTNLGRWRTVTKSIRGKIEHRNGSSMVWSQGLPHHHQEHHFNISDVMRYNIIVLHYMLSVW